MPRNDGKASEAIFLANTKGAVFRLRDKRDLMGLNKGKNVAAFANPSDFIVAEEDSLVFTEVKSSMNPTSFPLAASFKKGQLAAMTRLANDEKGHLYKIYIHNVTENKWYIMNATQFVNLVKQGKKSIKWIHLDSLTAW